MPQTPLLPTLPKAQSSQVVPQETHVLGATPKAFALYGVKAAPFMLRPSPSVCLCAPELKPRLKRKLKGIVTEIVHEMIDDPELKPKLKGIVKQTLHEMMADQELKPKLKGIVKDTLQEIMADACGLTSSSSTSSSSGIYALQAASTTAPKPNKPPGTAVGAIDVVHETWACPP